MQMYLNISFFLSAEHWIVIDGKKGQPHTHIWEISAKIASESFNGTDLGTGFTEVESVVRKYLSYYEGKTLNLLKPFDRFSPSTENLGLYFSQGIKGKLAEHGFVLMELAISESPTRGFVVTGLQEDAGFIGGALPDEFYQQHQGPVDTEPAGSAAVVVSGEDVLEDAAQEAAATDEEKMEDEEEDTQQGDNLESAAVEEGKTVWRVFWALLVIFCVNLLIYYPVLFTKAQLPWGSDSMGHVFKAEYLYQAIMQGDWFPRYLADWYNGIDPFRYWAPLPYYVLALVRFFTGDMVRAVNLFLFIVSFVGSGSWLLFRNRLTLVHSVALALIWVVVPENLRVGFSEGNVPRMLALMFLPLLIYLVLAIQNSEKRGIKIVALAATVSLIILSHAMMGALFLITLTLYLFLIMLFGGTSFKDFIRTVGVFVVGILLTCWWLVPSLVGGITGVNAEAATDTMRYFSPVVRLNPWERLHNYDAFYFGISYFVLALAALFQWSRKKFIKRQPWCWGYWFLPLLPLIFGQYITNCRFIICCGLIGQHRRELPYYC